MTILINNPETDNKDSLEQRVTALEVELARVQKILANTASTQSPWWLKVAGSMETDPTFDEAVRLGQEWRKSQQ